MFVFFLSIGDMINDHNIDTSENYVRAGFEHNNSQEI